MACPALSVVLHSTGPPGNGQPREAGRLGLTCWQKLETLYAAPRYCAMLHPEAVCRLVVLKAQKNMSSASRVSRSVDMLAGTLYPEPAGRGRSMASRAAGTR